MKGLSLSRLPPDKTRGRTGGSALFCSYWSAREDSNFGSLALTPRHWLRTGIGCADRCARGACCAFPTCAPLPIGSSNLSPGQTKGSTLAGCSLLLIGRGEKIRTSVRCRSPRGIGCPRQSGCAGPLRTQCVLHFAYLGATADRKSESSPRHEARADWEVRPPLY